MSFSRVAVLSAVAIAATFPRVADAQSWQAALDRTRPAVASDSAAPAASAMDAGLFRFGPLSRSALQMLWGESVSANEERVACIGGYVENGNVHITKVARLEPAFADSARVSAAASLRECRPPQWIGTVHTHIAKFNGMPYTTFSAPDREVMARWTQRWETAGTFCILYSEFQAHCEVSSGPNGDALYSPRPAAGQQQQQATTFAGKSR